MSEYIPYDEDQEGYVEWLDQKAEIARLREEPGGWLTKEEREAVSGIALVVGRLKIYPLQPCRTKKDDIDLLLRIAEGKVLSAPSASGGGEGEPVAWARRFHECYERLAPQYGYETRKDTRVFDPESQNGKLMCAVMESIVCGKAPPQPRGWLTGEEFGVIKRVRDHLFDTDQLEFTDIVTLDAILARSTPPEVVLPGTQVRYHNISVEDQRDAQWIKALAAAGIKVKEVGE